MTTEGRFVQLATLKFVGHYDHWSMLMDNFFRSKKYLQVVKSGISVVAYDVDYSNEQKKGGSRSEI